MSSAPPATKPATSTRWNGDTSSLAGIGVSTGTSYSDAPQPAAAAQTNVRPTSASLAFVLLLSHAVIDFLEEVVVLPDLGIVWFERKRFVVRLAGLFELAFVFVCNRQIVVGGRVTRVQFDRLLPAIDRLTPQTTLGDVDAEIHLRTGLVAFVGECRRCRHEEERDQEEGDVTLHDWIEITIAHRAMHVPCHFRQIRPYLAECSTVTYETRSTLSSKRREPRHSPLVYWTAEVGLGTFAVRSLDASL